MGLPTSGSGVPTIQAHFDSLSAAALSYLQSVLTTGSPLTLRANDAAEVPLTIQGAVGQTANLLTIEDSSGVNMIEVGPDGEMLLINKDAGNIPFTIRGAVAQAANLFVIENSAGNDLVTVQDSGGARISCAVGGGYIAWGDATFGEDGLGSAAIGFNSSNKLIIRNNASSPSAHFDASTTAGQTRFLVYDVDNGQIERVTVGAADSGGVGFKVLRIPN